MDFRNKRKFGYRGHKETFCFGGERKERYYLFEYYKEFSFRRSCEVCHFANTVRPSDITLADYWGNDPNVKRFNYDDKGCSLVLINTEKGKCVFNLISDCVITIETTLDQSLQPNLQHPSKKHPQREMVEHDYSVNGFEYVARKYGNLGITHWKENVRISLKFAIKRIQTLFKS